MDITIRKDDKQTEVSVKALVDTVLLDHGESGLKKIFKELKNATSEVCCPVCGGDVYMYDRMSAVLGLMRLDVEGDQSYIAGYRHKDANNCPNSYQNAALVTTSHKSKLPKIDQKCVEKIKNVLFARLNLKRNKDIFTELMGHGMRDEAGIKRILPYVVHFYSHNPELAKMPWLLPYYIAKTMGTFNYVDANGLSRKMIYKAEDRQIMEYRDEITRKDGKHVSRRISLPLKLIRVPVENLNDRQIKLIDEENVYLLTEKENNKLFAVAQNKAKKQAVKAVEFSVSPTRRNRKQKAHPGQETLGF